MSNHGQFNAARADRKPSGYARALKAARKECSTCFVVGGHDPLCRKQSAAQRAARAAQEATT